MNLQQRLKQRRDLRHKARRKIRGCAINSSGARTGLITNKYNEKRAETQKKVVAFREKNKKEFVRRKI